MALNQNETEEAIIDTSISDCHRHASVIRRQGHERLDVLDRVAEEVPVALVYNGVSHVVMMTSPNNLEEFALGFSLSEGIVNDKQEIYGIDLVAVDARNVRAGIEIRLEIATQLWVQLKQRRRNLTGRTGCGLCGAESIKQAIRPIKQVKRQPPATSDAVDNAVRSLADQQTLQSLTGAVHGAAWCDHQGSILIVREDVGRHNALDKLIGALKTADINLEDGFALVSSRASYEMVLKASSCGISTLVAVSAPTGLALDLAKQAGLNLIAFARPERHVVYNPAGKTRK